MQLKGKTHMNTFYKPVGEGFVYKAQKTVAI